MAIIKGQLSAQQTNDLEFIPNVGMRTIIRRSFAIYSEAVAYAASLFSSGVRVSVRQQGDAPIWNVESAYEGDPNDPDADLQNTHELSVNIERLSIKLNPYLRSQFTGNAFAAMAAVQKVADKYLAGDYASTTDAITALADQEDIDSADLTLAGNVFYLFISGADEYISHDYVYTHTFNFGSQTDLTLDNSNVGAVFTTAQLRDAEAIPANQALPNGEWLKLPPEEATMYGGREVLKYEYWHAASWDSLLYPRKS